MFGFDKKGWGGGGAAYMYMHIQMHIQMLIHQSTIIAH